MKTIFIDIDGTILKHNGDLSAQIKTQAVLLPGVLDAINDWNRKGYHIVLTTGRKECMRNITERDLLSNGVFYDQLVMGLPRGERIIINDSKPDSEITTRAFTVNRNEGLSGVRTDIS
jgi:hypothetical protein